MKARDDRNEIEDEGRWWRLDFTTVMVLMVLAALLMIMTFELWHSHPLSHFE